MFRLLAILLCLATITFEAEAQGDPYSGNALLSQCEIEYPRDKGETFNAGVCLGKIFGWRDMADIAFSQAFCIPQTADMKQLIDVTLAFLRRNPHRRHERASILWLDAMREAYRCR